MQTAVQPRRCSVFRSITALVLIAAFLPATLPAAERKTDKSERPVRKRKVWAPQGDLDQDFPFTKACITAPFPGPKNDAYKGIAIHLGNNTHVCFDPDLLRMAFGWTGNFLNLTGVAYDSAHGSHPSIAGDQKFGAHMIPGIANALADFKDTRSEPFGPISKDLGHWEGLYLQGDDVILSYTVMGNKVLEMPASIKKDDQIAFARDIKLAEKVKEPFCILIADVDGGSGKLDKGAAVFEQGGNAQMRVALVDAPKSITLEIQNHTRLVLRVGKGTPANTFRVTLWQGPQADAEKAAPLFAEKPTLIEPRQCGPARWPETVTTKGVLNFDKTPDSAYVVDQLTPPVENPWKRRVRPGGFDFFSDGKRAAMCTWDGDIWIVSGIDSTLDSLVWKRFASGGYENLGLKIVNDVIYTSGRDQITRYHDFDGDGECDFYENFNSDVTSSDGFHEFVFDLQADSHGNFYFGKAGPVRGGGRGFGGDNFGTISAHCGTVLKVSPDGKNLEVFATGFRAPNGMGMSPDDQVSTGDNEGTWVPACPINMVEQGGFYGVETLAHRKEIPEFKPPLCWMSHQDIDNSGGGQVWVTSDKWGPLQNQMLHMSYGKSSLYLVMKEKLFGQWQGGVVRFPLKFTSSTMRARFNAIDGQLYICGLQGWQTTAAKIAGFDRVRYTGKPVYSVCDLQVRKGEVRLTFTQPLDKAYATDAQNYSLKRWNYHRAEDYGSPEFSVADPKKQGRDDVEVTSAYLSPDGKTVRLEIADLKPVMEQSIQFDLKAKDGTPIKQYLQHTINLIP
jgi:hypothetical protein